MCIQPIVPIQNNEELFKSQEILIQIKKIEKWLLEQNLFNDKNLLFSLMKTHNYSFFSQDKIISKNFSNLKTTSEEKIKKLIEIPPFVKNIKDSDSMFLRISETIQEEKILIKDINKQIIQSFQNKQKKHLKFENKINLIKQNIDNYLQQNILLEKNIKLEKQKNKENFLFKNQIFNQMIQKKNEHIRELFYNQNILLNKQIKQLNLRHQNDLKKIENIYEQNLKQIKDTKKKNEQLISQKMTKINNVLQKKLDQHNQILEQEQIKFLQNQKLLKDKTRLFFRQKKLQMFFSFDFVEPKHKKNFLLLSNDIQKTLILNLTNLHIWRKKYIKIKLIYNLQMNWQLFEEQNLKSKICDLQIENNFFRITKEQEIINNRQKQQIQYLQEQLKILEINKKYKIMLLEIKEEQQKNKNNFLQLKQQFHIETQLYDLFYNKEKFILEQEQIQKKFLIKKQLKIKKIKLKQELLQNIIEYCQELIRLKQNLIKLKSERQNKIEQQQNIFEYYKQKFIKKTEEIQITIKSHIELCYQKCTLFTDELIKIINYLLQQHHIQKKTIYIFEKKIMDIFISQKAINHLNSFPKSALEALQNLIQNFMDNVQEKQFYYHFLLQKKIFLLENFILQQNIYLHQIILKYYDQKMTLINNQLHKMKLKYNKNNSQIFLELESKIKKYEKFYTYLQKEAFEMQKENIKQTQQYNQKIQNLKKQQNQMLQKHNNLQFQIFQICSNIVNYQKKSNNYLNKFYLWFWKKKLLSCFSAMIKNFILNGKKLKLKKLYILKQLEKICNNNSSYQQNFLQQQKKKIIIWNLNNFLLIIEQMHMFEIENISNSYTTMENQLHTEINCVRQKINHQVRQTNYKNNLIEINLNDALEELEKELKQKINYNKINKIQKIQKLTIQFNLQQEFIQNIQKSLEKQKQILNIKQKQEQNMILFFLKNIFLKYNKNHLILTKQIKEKDKKINFQINYIKFKNRVKNNISQISFFWKLKKEQCKLYYQHFNNVRKCKKNIKDQIFWYQQFYIV